MRKTYLKPELNIVSVDIHHILAGSPLDGSTPGDEYSEGDVTYSRRNSNSFWDDDDEEDW